MALPNGLMQQKPRGIFGGSVRPSPMVPTATAEPQKKGFDWQKLIGVLGDSLSIAGGGQAQYVPNLLERRQLQDARQYAEQAYQRRRGDELADYGEKQKLEAQYGKPAQPHRWERNDGSLMELGPDGKPHVAYEDPTPKMMFLPDGAGGGRWVEQPRPNQSFGAAPDTLPADFNEFDADAPAPSIGAAPGRPNTVSRSAYQAWVNERGQAEADALLQRNGLRVGNY